MSLCNQPLLIIFNSLETVLSRFGDAYTFSQIMQQGQRVILESALGDSSDLIDTIMESIENVSIDITQ